MSFLSNFYEFTGSVSLGNFRELVGMEG